MSEFLAALAAILAQEEAAEEDARVRRARNNAVALMAGQAGATDATRPTCTITCAQSSPTSAATLNFTITFSEVVTGFVDGDFTVSGGTKSNFAGSGTTYTCDVTPTTGTVTADVAADVAVDAAGNTNTAATQVSLSIYYGNLLVNAFGANEVWSLVDIASGSVVGAEVAAARNGVANGITLQNSAGPVTGSNAPLFDGTNADYCNIRTTNGTTGLTDIFSGVTGSFFIWGKVQSAGVWTDGAFRRLLSFNADNTNNHRISAYKTSTNNQIQVIYVAGGTTETINITYSDTGWFSIGVSWDRTAGANGEVKAYINGAQSGATQTSLGTWGGTADWSTGHAIIGTNALSASQMWSGWMAYAAVKCGSVWSAANFLAMHNAAATAAPDT